MFYEQEDNKFSFAFLRVLRFSAFSRIGFLSADAGMRVQ